MRLATYRMSEEDPLPHNAAAAATARAGLPLLHYCGYCGTTHAPDRTLCPARSAVCRACQKKGHFKVCCRNARRFTHSKAPAHAVSGAVTTAGTRISRQPTVEVSVTHKTGRRHPAVAIADMRAQVCVAGPALLAALSIKPASLKGCGGLKDVADLLLKCLGSCVCNITLGGRSTQQEIYFLHSAKSLFLSLDTCKELGLVPDGFPHHTLVGCSGTGCWRRDGSGTRQANINTISTSGGACRAAGRVAVATLFSHHLQHCQKPTACHGRQASSYPRDA